MVIPLRAGRDMLNGSPFEQDFLHLSPNISLRYHAAVRSKGANSGINVRSPLVAHNLGACLMSNTPDSATLQMPSAWLKALPSWDEMSRVHAVVNSPSLCFLQARKKRPVMSDIPKTPRPAPPTSGTTVFFLTAAGILGPGSFTPAAFSDCLGVGSSCLAACLVLAFFLTSRFRLSRQRWNRRNLDNPCQRWCCWRRWSFLLSNLRRFWNPMWTSRCCRCYWCRVAPGLPPCFQFPNKSNINQVELVRISKGLEQMIGKRATPQIGAECRDS